MLIQYDGLRTIFHWLKESIFFSQTHSARKSRGTLRPDTTGFDWDDTPSSKTCRSSQPSSSTVSCSFVNFTGEEENANCCYGSWKELAQIRASVIVLCSLGRAWASSRSYQPHTETAHRGLQHTHLHLHQSSLIWGALSQTNTHTLSLRFINPLSVRIVYFSWIKYLHNKH